MAKPAFPGFDRKLLGFLGELGKNNDRQWFQANKTRYQEHVQEPLLAFVRAIAPKLARISAEIVADDRKVGGAMMRIQRDTRFARDKSPYKDWVALRFWHSAGKDADAPGLYLRIHKSDIALGTGVWQPQPKGLAALRDHIVEHPARWKRIRDGKKFKAVWTEEYGDRLKRPPKGYDKEHPLVEDLKRKDFVWLRHLKPAALTKPDFLDAVVADYRASARMLAFLCEGLGLPI